MSKAQELREIERSIKKQSAAYHDAKKSARKIDRERRQRDLRREQERARRERKEK